MGSPLERSTEKGKLGIGIAFRKEALKAAGGFNQDLQVFEYLDLEFRTNGFKGVKNPGLTVLHLEPEKRFSLSGYLRRKAEYGFWVHSLYYLYPSRVSIVAFPLKLALLIGLLSIAAVFRSYWPIVALIVIYAVWISVRYKLFDSDNQIRFAASNFSHWYTKLSVYLVAISIIGLGDLASDIGKLHGLVSSPTRGRRLIVSTTNAGSGNSRN